MNTDFRVNVNFLDHPKTVKLERRLGFVGVKSLMRLWSWSAINRPDGQLGTDIEDIEIAGQWSGEPDLFVNTLVALRWLDLSSDGNYSLHDWEEYQPEALRRHRYEQSGGYDENGNRLFPENWQSIKAAVYRRDGRQCQYCGTVDGPFHVDHVIPRIKGGKDEPKNLVVSCASCNLSKGSKSVSEWLGVHE